jgi:enoyl-[acyl-carrier protein] reductase I
MLQCRQLDGSDGRREQETEGATMGQLDGQTGLVFGVANKRSIAWGIAQALHREGMRLAFTYQGERLETGVRELAESLDPA